MRPLYEGSSKPQPSGRRPEGCGELSTKLRQGVTRQRRVGVWRQSGVRCGSWWGCLALMEWLEEEQKSALQLISINLMSYPIVWLSK